MNWVMAGAAGVVLLAVALLGCLVEFTFLRLSRARASGLDEAAGTNGNGRSIAALVDDRESVVGPASVLRLAMEMTLIVGVVVVLRAHPWWVLLAALVGAGAVLYAVCHAGARRLATESNDAMAIAFAPVARVLRRVPPLRWLARLLALPAVALGPKARTAAPSDVADTELVAMASQAAEEHQIDDAEAALIGSIIRLGDTMLRAVMVPRPDMVTVPASMSVEAALKLTVESGYSRFPVVGEGPDDVLGVAHAKDLVRAQMEGQGSSRCGDLSREATFVPETKRAAALMKDMQESSQHMAICVDEHGGIAGLVTLEDLIEELVGEIFDEFDDAEQLVSQDGSKWRLSGRLPVADLGKHISIELPEGEWETLGGLLLDVAGHVPEKGEVVTVSGHAMTTLEVEGRRIKLVEVEAD